MEWVVTNLSEILDIATKIVAVAAAVAAIVPQGSSASGVIATVRRLIDVLALNVGNARNEEKIT